VPQFNNNNNNSLDEEKKINNSNDPIKDILGNEEKQIAQTSKDDIGNQLHPLSMLKNLLMNNPLTGNKGLSQSINILREANEELETRLMYFNLGKKETRFLRRRGQLFFKYDFKLE